MKLGYIFLLLMLLLSCEGRKQTNSVEEFIVTEPDAVSKLEQLMSLPQDSVLDYYDLSNDLLTEFPDLSDYTIKSLNLSHNYLDTTVMILLPHGLVSLNLSHNNIRGGFPNKKYKSAEIERLNQLEEVNISHNNIKSLVIYPSFQKVNASYNDLNMVGIIIKHVRYLDISNNPNLSNVLQLDPAKVDTIIHHNIANDKKLIWILKQCNIIR